jgi:glycosyltransferase involved in cell wall biosynthesis
VIVALAESVGWTVALSRSASELLVERYLLDPRRIKLIPHGVPDLPAASEEPSNPSLELGGRKVVLSFGLLAPAKRLERVLAALPAIVARHPDTTYVVLGATHPTELANAGEAYREHLTGIAKQLGVARNVRFVNEFPGRFELTRWIQAADVVVIPEGEARRTDAATLAYAMAAGRAIVTSRNAYAIEMLGGGAGVLATTAPAGLAAAVNRLLAAPEARRAMGARAHERASAMSWTRVGASYRDLFARVAGKLPSLTGDVSVLPAIA